MEPSSETQGLLVGTMRYFRASDIFGAKVYFKGGQCKTQTADCRLQTADCRPGVKCRLRVKCRLQSADQG